MFLPFVGSASKAGGMAKLGAGGFRQALARGVITEEALGAGRLTTAMVDGVLSQMAVEIPVALQKARNQADYGLEDSAINILGGGIFAGGIHLTVRGVSAVFRRASEMHSRLKPDTQETLLLDQERAFVTGDKPETARIIQVDENVIRERVRFDEAAARAEATRAVDIESGELSPEGYRVLGGGLFESDVPPGPEAIGVSKGTKTVTKDGKTTTRTTYQFGLPPKPVTEEVTPESIYDAALAEFRKASTEFRKVTERYRAREINDQEFLAAKAKFKEADEAFNVAETAFIDAKNRAVGLDAKADTVRTQRIEELVAAKKAQWEATLAQRIDAERAAEIARQQAEGKILPPEQIKRYAASQVPKEAEINAVKEDAATLEKEILATALTPEEKVALQKELDELQEGVYFDKSKSIDAAIPCVTRNA